MRPVSGDDLVTAALQSSLARAQRNFKLSKYKQLKHTKKESGGSSDNRFEEEGEKAPLISPLKKLKALKFQNEFDLWIEQANNLSFTSEGYINGAKIPADIECLNSVSKKGKKSKARSKDKALKKEQEGSGGVQQNGGTTVVKEKKKESVAEVEGIKGVLKGKNKQLQLSDLPVVTENSFELLKKLKETRKEKKKLVKLRKRLLKEGHSKEETEKLICQAKKNPGGVGAIFQKLKASVLPQQELSSLSNSSKLQQKLTKKDKKKMKMSLENGEENDPTSFRPNTPPARPTSSPSANGGGGGSINSTNGRVNGASPGNNSSGGGGGAQQHQLPQPKVVLYPREKITPGYIDKMPVGAGFFNMGNSCYLNASLQAVFHVPAFINWLKQDTDHRSNCRDNMNCIVCAMKKTLDSAMSRQNPPPSAIRPVEIINRLRSICRHFSHGRQEDAHEFLRYLFESMERSYLAAINCLRIDNRSKETNPLGQIFGGYLRTEVTCLKCQYVSTTFQPTAELQLDIRHVTSLEDAIMNHFKKERLDNNDYKCEKCKTISQATKQFSLEIPPIVLCLQLKRFTLYGTKIAKRIHCNRFLDMSKFMHKSKQVNGFTNLRYRLVALVTHLGSSPNCGHYTAIAEAANGHFYQFDDSYVHQVTVATALNNDAYVIIYEMDKRTYKSPEASSTATSTSSSSTSYATNLSNLGYPSSTVTSPNTLFPKKLPSTPIPKISSTQPSKLVQSNNENMKSTAGATNGSDTSVKSISSISTNGNTFKPGGLDKERKMISFGIRTTNKINILKPGAPLTNSSSANGKFPSSSSPSVASNSPLSTRREMVPERTVKLVPYNDDENDESDSENVKTAFPNSKEKRLKSPENGKHSPKNSEELPITPPKSPKMTPFSPKPKSQDNDSGKGSSASDSPGPSTSSSRQVDYEGKRDSVKRKAPEDDDEDNENLSPTKSRVPQVHRSSSSDSASSRSTSGGSPDRSGSHNSNKRRRSEDSIQPVERKPSTSSSSQNSSGESNARNSDRYRDSYSQERDRERRRDRNPSPEKREKRGSSIDQRQLTSAELSDSSSFDVSRLKASNSRWNGQKSVLSKAIDEERKKSDGRNSDDEFNDEFDEGRVKKVRRSRSLPRETENGINKFQSIEDRKRQVEQWRNVLDGYSRDRGSNSNSDSKSWSNGGGADDSSRHRKGGYPSRPNSSNGSRPRHSSSSSNSHSSSSSSNYSSSKNSHGHGRRSPYRNGHHGNGGGGGGSSSSSSHYRSQSHGSHHHHGSSKHWNGDRNRH